MKQVIMPLFQSKSFLPVDIRAISPNAPSIEAHLSSPAISTQIYCYTGFYRNVYQDSKNKPSYQAKTRL